MGFRDNRSGGRGFGGGGRNFGGGGRDFGGGGRDYDRPQMHKATCSSCNKECEVPFRPTGSKPVFCSDCFRNNKGGDFRRNDRGFSDRPQRDQQPDNRTKEQLDAISAKLDKILEMLTVPVHTVVEPVLAEVAMGELGEVEVKTPKAKPAKKAAAKKPTKTN